MPAVDSARRAAVWAAAWLANGGMRRELGLLAVTLAGTFLLGSCAVRHPEQQGPVFSAGHEPAWLITRSALGQVTADPAVRQLLGKAPVYQLLQPGQQPLAAVRSQAVVGFTSLAALREAVTGRKLPAGTRAVLYDPEAWSFTPLAEQLDPARAVAQASAVAHAHGLILIASPALNLVTRHGHSSKPRWRQFLELRLAAAVAAHADIVELQAQSLERDSGIYARFVREAAAQVRKANPHAMVMAGLSTNPPGAAVSASQLTAAVRATRTLVRGYWLNIPGRGPKCPTCHEARPQLGIELLREVLPAR